MNINYKKTLNLNKKVEFTNKHKNLSSLSSEHIKKLDKKLIETVKGIGYKFGE